MFNYRRWINQRLDTKFGGTALVQAGGEFILKWDYMPPRDCNSQGASHRRTERGMYIGSSKIWSRGFLTSRTSAVTAVVKIGDTVVGNGRPGSRTM